MSKLTVETDKYGLVRVKVETTKSGTPVTYRVPANTGLSGQNDQAIAAIVEKINETDDLIPQDTSSENQLINEKALREFMLSIIGGRKYKTTKIGNQIWLAENLDLNFSGLTIGQSGTSESVPRGNYYQNDLSSYGKYGILYNWGAVKYLEDNKSSLIPGWHVPTIDEWDALAIAVGGASVAGTKLKSTTDWSSGAGTDDYGFSALPAGGYSGDFYNFGSDAYFWTATENDRNNAYDLYFKSSASINSSTINKSRQYSVRLVRDT